MSPKDELAEWQTRLEEAIGASLSSYPRRVVWEMTFREAVTFADVMHDARSYIPKHEAAVTLGRLGGQKGGRARAESLSPERRSEIARKAANVRWGNT